jgi:hypothetical protein
LDFVPDTGIWLPAVFYAPEQQKGTPVIMVHEEGKKAVADEARKLMQAGHPVLAVDLRGNGETQQSEQTKFGEQIGNDWEDFYKAYILGKSYVGMRAEDILNCTKWLHSQYKGEPVELRSAGNTGIPALHAAALEPMLFSKISVDRCLASWKYAVHQSPTYNQLINTVHGALRYYDLPDLRALSGEKITFTRPLDAQGNPAGKKQFLRIANSDWQTGNREPATGSCEHRTPNND